MKSFLLTLVIAIFTSLTPIAHAAQINDQLVFAVDIIRHGDRTPAVNLPTIQHEWKEGLGQLTATGMKQEFELGKMQHHLYIDKYHLLTENYQPGSLYVRSSDFDRTLMSAESFLSGLYPLGTGPTLPNTDKAALPHRYQPIPIHTIPQADETLLIPDSEAYKYKDLIKRYVYPTAEWQAKTSSVQSKFEAWSKATGIKITDLDQLKSIGDVLYIDALYQIPLPVGLTEDDAQTIIEAGSFAFVTEFKNATIGKITGHQLLSTIVDALQKAEQSPSSLKYILFSAHDSTLLSQLSALGVPATERPPYSSHLSFQLFQNAEKNYYVKVFYNNKEVAIPSCQKEGCTLAQLSAIANSK